MESFQKMMNSLEELIVLKARFYDAFILHQTAQAAMQEIQAQILLKEQAINADEKQNSLISQAKAARSQPDSLK